MKKINVCEADTDVTSSGYRFQVIATLTANRVLLNWLGSASEDALNPYLLEHGQLFGLQMNPVC